MEDAVPPSFPSCSPIIGGGGTSESFLYSLLVNDAAYQAVQDSLEEISDEQFRWTLETNIFGYFYMARAALPHLTKGDAIVNTGSIVGLVGEKHLIDYCTSKGAIHAFTKALTLNLGPKDIRVNCVCPGPASRTSWPRSTFFWPRTMPAS